MSLALILLADSPMRDDYSRRRPKTKRRRNQKHKPHSSIRDRQGERKKQETNRKSQKKEREKENLIAFRDLVQNSARSAKSPNRNNDGRILLVVTKADFLLRPFAAANHPEPRDRRHNARPTDQRPRATWRLYKG
jgi:outer membrane biosynthesis protein TonB